MSATAAALAALDALDAIERSRPARPGGATGAGGGASAAAASNAAAPNATMTGRHDLTASIARFRVRPDDGVPAFEPGQYLALGLELDGRLLQRPYSTASPRGTRDELEFLVRLVPGGAFTPRLWAVPVGGRLRVGRPKGLFTLRPDDSRTHLFIATGTGLAPFVSMIETILAGGRSTRAIVVHGVSHVAELAYRDRLERLAGHRRGVHYVPAISRPDHPANAGWTGSTGRIDVALERICETHALDPRTTVAYLCGNPEMIAAGERILTARGFPPDGIVSEHYWPGQSESSVLG